jgi:hypothetical protein
MQELTKLRNYMELNTYCRQSSSYSRICKYFMDPKGSLPCSQELSTGFYLSQINLFPTTSSYFSKVGRTLACVKTCNSQHTMSATWRKERSKIETNEIMKTAAHRSESWCLRQFYLFCLMSWCLSWRSWCTAALRSTFILTPTSIYVFPVVSFLLAFTPMSYMHSSSVPMLAAYPTHFILGDFSL